MRLLLWQKNRRTLILAALTAGTFSVSAVAAQNTQSATAQTKKSAHKSTTDTTATHSSQSATTKGSATKKSTSGKSSSRRRSKKVKGQAAPTPERINEIQDALAKKGAFDGTPTGKWDDSTVDAMKKFQAANGINPTGKLDALTLQKLGLGSETAGLAAPTPPPNTANRLRNPSSSPAEPPTEPSN
jgi:peptidoglycan hydrolase-like protein with peptidoglycan-binding domain